MYKISADEALPKKGELALVWAGEDSIAREARLSLKSGMWQFSDRTLDAIHTAGTFWIYLPHAQIEVGQSKKERKAVASKP